MCHFLSEAYLILDLSKSPTFQLFSVALIIILNYYKYNLFCRYIYYFMTVPFSRVKYHEKRNFVCYFTHWWIPSTEKRASQVTLVKNPPAGGARDVNLVPGLGRCPGVGNGKLLQYSCLENSPDRGARQATVHGVEKSQTRQHGTSTEKSLWCRVAILKFLLNEW